MSAGVTVPAWAQRLIELRRARLWAEADLARELKKLRPDLPAVKSLTHMIRQDWESGAHRPGPRYRLLLATLYDVTEADLFGVGEEPFSDSAKAVPAEPDDDEIDALELSRRVAASDVSEETLVRLELVVDDLAVSYASTPPAELLGRLRRHLAYVGQLLESRKTLGAHRRLLVVGGWLSLLAATCHVDLHQRPAALARLRTAAQLAQHAEHPEIAAWCVETQAWQALTDGDYRQAVILSQGAQEIAPAGSSAYIQATAQEGRAWARLSAGPQTRALLDRVARLASSLVVPERPEHHYRYDPAKADAYTATTLSWLGDPAAEPYARRVLARLESHADGPPRPRRAASARLDLSLALLAADKPDEAAHATLTAVTSGVLVPSNYWRATEVIAAVETRGVPEAAQLREAYRELCGPAPIEVHRALP